MGSAEAAQYLNISLSTLHKKTMLRELPFYKPSNKLLYFKREELDEWLQNSRVKPASEIDREAQAYCMKKGGRK